MTERAKMKPLDELRAVFEADDLDAQEKLVLLYLIRRADNHTWLVGAPGPRPKDGPVPLATIARRTRLSRTTVHRVTVSLEQKGRVKRTNAADGKVRRSAGGHQETAVYDLHPSVQTKDAAESKPRTRCQSPNQGRGRVQTTASKPRTRQSPNQGQISASGSLPDLLPRDPAAGAAEPQDRVLFDLDQTPARDHQQRRSKGLAATSEEKPRGVQKIQKAHDAYATAYAEGIREASGKPFAIGTDKRPLISMATEHARTHAGETIRGDELVAWFRSTAEEYRRVRDAEAQFESGFSPAGCLRWLNAGKPEPKRRGNGAPRQPQAPGSFIVEPDDFQEVTS